MTGNVLAFSFQGLLFASILYSLPFAVRPFAAAFASVDRRLIEASWCLGISRLRTFVQIACPLSWAGIVTGLVLSFAHTLGEFGVVLMVGATSPGSRARYRSRSTPRFRRSITQGQPWHPSFCWPRLSLRSR